MNIKVFKAFFSFGKKVVQQAEKTVPKRTTQVFTDPITGVLRKERAFIGSDGVPRYFTSYTHTLADGTKKTIVEARSGMKGDSFEAIRNSQWTDRLTSEVTTKQNGSILGGNQVKIHKNKTKWWCHSDETNLTKEYDTKGVLQHKELAHHRNIGNETHIYNNATQDRVYNEYPLTSSIEDMYKVKPSDNPYIRHTLNGESNAYRFASGESAYSKAVKAQEQAAIDAAKKAEAEATATKEAAKKAEEALKATRPRINVGKVLNGKNIEELQVKESKLADGTIERIYTEPGSDKVLIKTQDKGLLHREWIDSDKYGKIIVKQVGKKEPYIVAKKGNITQISGAYDKLEKVYDGKQYVEKAVSQPISMQYYNEGGVAFKRAANSGYSLDGRVKVFFDSEAAAKRAAYPEMSKYYPDYVTLRIYGNSAVKKDPYRDTTILEQIASNTARKIQDVMDKALVDLKDLFKPFEK